MDKVILTTDGFKKFKQEQSDLIIKRKETLASLVKARDMGDLSENGAYKSARFELGNIDRRLRQLESLLKKVEIIENNNNSVISIGSSVSLVFNNKETTYQIVGKHEANPKNGKISHESHLGSSLIGKRVGDKIILNRQGGEYAYEVKKIN